ncbi:MAG: hypothetical protein JWP78_2058 [Mucilaginibacter sp.]|nr:hypothetical protein [Mucilaginibacter sp.]
MKSLYFHAALAVFLLAPLCALAQSSPKRVLGSFIYNHKVYNYEFVEESSDSYNLKISGFPSNAAASAESDASKVAKETTKKDTTVTDTTTAATDTLKKVPSVTDASSSAHNLDYAFSELSQTVFTEVFTTQMADKFKVDINDGLKKEAIELFFKIKARLDFLDDEPVTANLILKKDVVYSVLKANASSYYHAGLSDLLVPHRVDRVMVETQDGAIKNVSVHLVNPKAPNDPALSSRKFIEFKNQYPISISSKFDADRLANINLYSFNCNGIEGLTRYIKLSDVLALDIILENNKEDYSPSDRVVTLSPSQPIVELKKEKRSHILDVSAFTDFVGLDQEQPNGLIQIEVKRKINLNTKSHPWFDFGGKTDLGESYNLSGYDVAWTMSRNKKLTYYTLTPSKAAKKDTTKRANNESDSTLHITVRNRKLRPTYYGFFGSIEPRLLFSKLDGNNRYYLLDTPTFTSKKLNPLKNYQYQLASFGFNLNMAKVSFPDLKFSWNLIDAGVYWYRSRVQAAWDTVSKHSAPLNNGILNLSTHIDFHPAGNWGLGFAVGRIWQHIWNNDYKLPVQAGLWQAGFDGFLSTNDDSKLFFRFRWTGEAHHFNNNFTQIQLGYSMNIFTGSSLPNK